MPSSKPSKLKEYRVAGELIRPNEYPRRELYIEKVRKAKGLGRWIYCKYCYKNVLPLLSGINQVVCSECGCGLTPDFFKFENLKRYLAGEDFEKVLEEDMNSKEAKAWFKKKKRHET